MTQREEEGSPKLVKAPGEGCLCTLRGVRGLKASPRWAWSSQLWYP